MSRPRHRWITAVAAVAALLATLGSAACETTGPLDRVSVLASWTDAEGEAFERVLDDFAEEHDIEVEYEGTRALSQVLIAGVRNGTAPDVALLPSPGELASYARRGVLHPLDGIPGLQPDGADGPMWLELASPGTSQLYAVAIKADLKSVVWYNPPQFDELYAIPETRNDLRALGNEINESGAAPWCMGMGSTPVSGWPGTDWLEDILLHQSGRDQYLRWAAGDLPWTSDPVREAWEEWGELIGPTGAVYGGAVSALVRDFAAAGRPMFTDPPGCFLDHQASFIMGSYQGYEVDSREGLQPGADFDFFPFPGSEEPAGSSGHSMIVSADLAGMFNDTPAARELIRYLASERARQVWEGDGSGRVFSLSHDVAPDSYPDEVSMRIAAHLTTSELCFDASDVMPATMANAFYQATMEFLHDPGRFLDDDSELLKTTLLQDLDSVRSSIDFDEWLRLPCGR